MNRDTIYGSTIRQRELSASKMKTEKLKDLLLKLKDGERRSKVRNENLIEDFQKVSNMARRLDIKTEKLKQAKRQYETYISTVYPEWRENIEVSHRISTTDPMQGSTPLGYQDFPDRDALTLPLHKAEGQREYRNHYASTPFNHHSTPEVFQRNAWSISSTPQREHFQPDYRPSYPGSLSGDRRNNSAYQHHNLPRMEQEMRHTPTIPDVSNQRSSPYRSFSSSPHHHHQQTGLNRMNEPSRIADECNLPKNSFPKTLNLSEIDPKRDVSEFTIIPQALALSPNGDLVLLPMTFSPRMQNTFSNVVRDPDNGTNQKEASRQLRSKPEDNRLAGGRHSESDNILDENSSTGNSLFTEREMVIDRAKDSGRMLVEKAVLLRDELGRSQDRMINVSQLGRSSIDESGEEPLQKQVPQSDNRLLLNKSKPGISSLSFGDSKQQRNGDVFAKENLLPREAHLVEQKLENVDNKITFETYDALGLNNKQEVGEQKSDHFALSSDKTNRDFTTANDVGGGENDEKLDAIDNDVDFDLRMTREKPVLSRTSVTDRDEVLVGSRKNLMDSNQVSDVTRKQSIPETFVSQKHSPVHELNESTVAKEIVESYSAPVDAKSSESSHEIWNGLDQTNTQHAKLDQAPNYSKEPSDIHDDVHLKEDPRHIDTPPVEKYLPSKNFHSSQFQEARADLHLDISDLSYLLEELENRMGIVSKTEFYQPSTEMLSRDNTEEIKRAVKSANSLDNIETRDLCAVAAFEISAQITQSGHESLVGDIEILKMIKSMIDFRNAILPGFVDLWEIVFNHMELLIGNHIFKPSIVAEKFACFLVPKNRDLQLQMCKALQKTLEGPDVESSGSKLDEDEESQQQLDQTRRNPDESSEANNSVHAGSNKDGSVPDKPLGKITLDEKPNEQKKEVKKQFLDDLSLDLGDVSEEDETSSTFDSTQFTAQRETKEHILSDDNQENDEETGDEQDNEESIQETQSNSIEDEDNNNGNGDSRKIEESVKETSDQLSDDSGSDLDDLLSSGLLSRGNERITNQKNPIILNRINDDPPDYKENAEDEKTSSEISPRKSVISPNNSKSISKKFRRPGFWDNSDSESEPEELKLSGGKNLSEMNEDDENNDDEFDFSFYK